MSDTEEVGKDISCYVLAVRSVFWLIEPYWSSYERNNFQFFIHSAAWSLPAVFLLTVYSLLASYWIDEYSKVHSMNDRVLKRRRIIGLVILNAIIYLGEVAMLLMSLLADRALYRVAQPNYLNVLYILSVIVFVLYGFLVYSQLKRAPVAAKSNEKMRRMHRVLAITIIITVSFAARVTVNVLWPTHIHPWAYKWIFQAVFYTLVEVVPVFLIVWMLFSSPKKTSYGASAKPLLVTQYKYGDFDAGGDMLNP